MAAVAQFHKFREAAESWVQDQPDYWYPNLALATVLGRLGQIDRARSIVARFSIEEPDQHFTFAQVLCAEGSWEAALDELETAVAKGYRNYVWLKVNPDFHALRGNPRFLEILASMTAN